VLIKFSDLLAARDWYPQISADGQVNQPLRFIDIDAAIPHDLSDLANRVCLLIGITRNPTAQVRQVARLLDLTLTHVPTDDEAFVVVTNIDQAMTQLITATQNCARAAMALGLTLRITTALPTADAIAAEASSYSTLLAGPEFAHWLSARSARQVVAANEIERVLTSITGSTLNIRMNRKLRLNAIDGAMRAGLVEAFSIALADPTLEVMLTGEGPCFSNGGDLREFGSTPDPATAWTVRMTQHPGWYLAQISDRSTAHVHGKCIGAGVEIPAFASRVIADPATTFYLPELAMGLIPGAGGCVSIPARIGRWRTLWMVLSGSTLTADEALTWGLIDDIAPVN